MSDRKRSHHQIMGDGIIPVFSERDKSFHEHIENRKAHLPAVIYIHVPYCFKICSFCSLRRSLNQPIADYGHIVKQDILNYRELPYFKEAKIESIYFGGGTPTTLPAESLEAIIIEIKRNFNVAANCEISLETTLSELDDTRLKAIKRAGANRLSIGVQTFKDQMRNVFNRRGDSDFAISRIKEAKKYIENVNIDIIYNYPNQTIEDVRRDVMLADTLGCNGFSMYSLMNMKEAVELESDRSKEKDIFLALVDEALSRGFCFHETTKMVKNDEYKYIKLRLNGSDTIPLGAGAGGSIAGMPIMNPIDVNDYALSIDNFDKKRGSIKNPDYMELERHKGFFQQCTIPFSLLDDYPTLNEQIDQLLKKNMIEKVKDSYKYTVEGVFWGNNISSDLVKIIAREIAIRGKNE